MVDLPPEETVLDKAIDIGTKVLESVPYYGIGVAAGFAQAFFTPPFEKRKHQWFLHLHEVITKLEANSITKEMLQNDEETMDIFIQATSIATKTLQQCRHDALKNALLNCAMHTAPEFAMQQIFINYIDDFTEWHLTILKFSLNPRKYFKEKEKTPPENGMGGIGLSLRKYLEEVHPELKAKNDLVTLVWSDLHAKSLLKEGVVALDSLMAVNTTLAPKATTLGEALIKFITV